MKKSLSVGLLLVVVLALGVSLPKNKVDVTKGPKGDQGLVGPTGPRGPQGLAGPVGPRGPKGDSLGAISGPDLWSPYWNVNGVTRFYNSSGLKQSTTTNCAFQSPSATSTLVTGSAQFTTASTAAAILVSFDKQTTRFGTTSTSVLLATSTISAGAQKTINALGSTTPNNTAIDLQAFNDLIIRDRTFSPSTWFVVHSLQSGNNVADLVGTGFVPVGSCKATFEVN